MNNIITMTLSNGNELVVEKYRADKDFPEEIGIFIKDKYGIIVQDICLVRPHYEYNNQIDISNTLIDCLVWSDQYNEDYTHKFIIPQYQEEEGDNDE